MSLHVAAPGKVNLCLFLGPTRDDGRHGLVTVFESVSLADSLTLEVLARGAVDEVRCAGVEGPNLAAAALAGLRARGWAAPGVRITIEKRIPVAAGMAGGSADAAAALRLARALGERHPDWRVPAAWLDELAPALGADVPSQLVPGLSLGTGAGERVEQAAPLAEHALVIVALPVALATPAVFREADRLGLPRSPDELRWALERLSGWLRRGARLPDDLVVNDLEPASRSLCPAIDDALGALRAAGAEHALVCGSGPTCAGLWWGSEASARAAAAAVGLRERFPGALAVGPVAPGDAEVSPAP